MNDEFELLAPAGSLEILKAVINAGANAVYLGGDLFGARAYANNFTKEELIEGLHYAHLHNAKVYLTVNTLLKNQEINKLYDYLLPYYEEGLDAVLVQDFGALQYIHEVFPDLEIHTSTQMTITGSEGVNLLKKYGVKRVVMAREMSVEEMAQIHQETGMELEAFIHGALCYCYSGQCLFSSLLGGRSGNRGRCAQPCRLPYTVLDEEHHKRLNESYILSLKDFCGISALEKLREAGVYSLKIEGRMKKISYAAGVVSTYRKIIDQMQHTSIDNFLVSAQKELEQYGNRCGFTDTYLYRHNGKNMVTFEKPSFYQENDNYHEISQNIPIDGWLTLKLHQPATLTINYKDTTVTVTKDVVQSAQKQALTKDDTEKRMRKTGNTMFAFDSLSIDMDEHIFYPNGALNQLRREALEELEQALLKRFRRQAIAAQVPLKDFDTTDAKSCIQGRAIVSVEARNLLPEICPKTYISDIYLDSSCYSHENIANLFVDDVALCKKNNKEVYFILPSVFRKETKAFYEEKISLFTSVEIDGFVVKTYEELQFVKEHFANKKIIADHNLYTYNDYAIQAFLQEGVYRVTVPLELNRNEIAGRDNTSSEMIIYGYYPMMTTAGCVNKNSIGCDHKSKILYLKDRKNISFPVKNVCNECYNVIYNSLPTNLFHAMDELKKRNVQDFRIHFTFETPEEVRLILNSYENGFSSQNAQNFTNGHYKRGVE